jgi:multidrug efflux pump subunit AcrA (membrane-fusion protein)
MRVSDSTIASFHRSDSTCVFPSLLGTNACSNPERNVALEVAHPARVSKIVVEMVGIDFVLYTPAADNLGRIFLRPGDLVQGGQVVARIAPSSLAAVSAEQAEAQVRQARAAVDQASAALGGARASNSRRE